MKNARLSQIVAGALLVATLTVSRSGTAEEPKPLQRFDFERIEMGVEFRIAVYACDSGVANKAVRAAFDRIRELNSRLSDYESESEVRQLCEQAPDTWLPVSEDLHRVLLHANQLSAETEGVFDVTVGHYTKLWRRARRRKVLPEAAELQFVSKQTGYRFLDVDPAMARVRLKNSGLRIDLGGIAKGYAVDEALKTLRENGIKQALVDGSGDIAVGDPPPGRASWRIEIAALRDSADADPVSIEIANCAVATSGDAFQAVQIAGTSYSHIIDPRTGWPLTTTSSVTVVAPNGMAADSLASAVSVLRAEAGFRLVETKKGTEAFVVTQRSGRVVTAETPGFRKLTVVRKSAPEK
ncbi:MAG: FAD:protein FMN transferase [Planctomycetota bacterium]|nr:FAD:protein FMN transferase [Planctomycetota bacterium]MDA1247723.1 FAD:protein FMN transferase [Planctomycetota bacterium]